MSFTMMPTTNIPPYKTLIIQHYIVVSITIEFRINCTLIRAYILYIYIAFDKIMTLNEYYYYTYIFIYVNKYILILFEMFFFLKY